ncbi:MAG TPA: toll/interleukin-1 receptor domain-containing protein [Thermoanaerobaculia bacterium]|nr:toll/interleukin-1 receptor domain-containing protein [Thermoanaerobaculia bacterium]
MIADASFDVFLSYNHADVEAVREIRERLAARGVRSFIDQEDLPIGKAFPAELERAMQNSRAVAVVFGKSGYGRWQHREIQYCLALQVESNGERPVIPLILDGAKPPTGFIAQNSWIDLSKGIDDASIERLVGAIDKSGDVATPPSDISPYRRLDAFREEDALLFFGRQSATDSIVTRIDGASGWDDRPRFVTVTGPSGSGKSSVVAAGVLPRLRSRRPPRLVWDAVVMQPRKDPWQSLATVLMPLLDPTLSEVDQLRTSLTLAETLCGRRGIVSTIERILAKSRGTDRLLIVVDQFEELFTQTDDGVAREFVRALLDGSRNAPLCVLATLRSDYYGKAIALDRDLSDVLPDGQVNLGPMRREELRDVILRPANVVRLTLEPGLVDRMLDDVGDEPGNLPLLEYALSELWDLREQGRLTLVGYQEIGGVSGALMRRAETIYGELSNAQQKSAKKLLMRLVRVSRADEEGSDTRRRAHRDEIGTEDWKLVHGFAGERARLVVVSKDPASGEDSVEVVHEALIRRWDRLREWLNTDREFLLWRQDLSLYRAGSPEGIPQGTLLATASKWLRERGDDLNPDEREYIEKSVTSAARTRRMRKLVLAAAVIAMVLLVGAIGYTRTAGYTVRTILAKNPEAHFASVDQFGRGYETNIARTKTLLRLERYDDIRRAIAAQAYLSERAMQLARLAVAMSATAPDRAGAILKEAIAAAKQANLVPRQQAPLLANVAKAAARLGDRKASLELLRSADDLLPYADSVESSRVWYRREVAGAWEQVGSPEHARRVLRAVLDVPATDENIYMLDEAAEDLVRLGESDVVRRLPRYIGDDTRLRSLYESVRVRAYAAAGDSDTAQRIAARLPREYREGALATVAKLDFARNQDLSRTRELVRTTEYGPDSALLDEVIGKLVRQNRDPEVEPLIAESRNPGARGRVRAVYVQQLIDAGRLDDAAHAAEVLKSDNPHNELRPLPFARLGLAFARAGRRTEAENALRDAVNLGPTLRNEYARDEVDALRAHAEAVLGRFHEARRIADAIESDERQWDAYFGILEVYAVTRNTNP